MAVRKVRWIIQDNLIVENKSLTDYVSNKPLTAGA